MFVLSRIVHAGAYVANNIFPLRFSAYLVGAFTLGIMWIAFAVRILSVPLPA